MLFVLWWEVYLHCGLRPASQELLIWWLLGEIVSLSLWLEDLVEDELVPFVSRLVACLANDLVFLICPLEGYWVC